MDSITHESITNIKAIQSVKQKRTIHSHILYSYGKVFIRLQKHC